MAKHIVNRFDFDTVVAGFFRVIENPGEYSKYKKLIEPEFFFYNDISPKPLALRKLIGWFHKYMESGKTKMPTLLDFGVYLKSYISDDEKDKDAKTLYESYRTNPDILEKMESDGCYDLFKDYLRIIRFIKYSSNIFDEYQKGDSDAAAKFMQETLRELALIRSEGEIEFDAEKDIDRILFEKLNNHGQILYMGLPGLDSTLGGFEQRTLNLFMSVTNGGKSMMAHHLIMRAIRQQMYVHVTCVEDRVESFVRKIVACLTGIPIARLKSFRDARMNVSPTTLESEQIKEAKRLISQYVKVDFVYGQSIEGVHKRKKEYDLECIAHNRPVPVVDIVDYTGHIANKSFGDKGFEKMRSAYAERKDFALTTGKICFDFAQVNREGSKRLGEEKTLTASDLAGSYDLAQVCDNIISINRSAINIETSTAVLKVAKARDGEVNHEYEVKTNFGAAQFLMDENTWLTAKKKDIDGLKEIDTSKVG